MSIVEQIESAAYPANHAAGAFPSRTLAQIEKYLPLTMDRSAETGCGKSTILFSNLSKEHHVFALDDRAGNDSSVLFYEKCPLTNLEVVFPHFGATQLTLPAFHHGGIYDAVLIDGPHGWPFPEIEYYFFYPHMREGSVLIIDDVAIPTIGRLADILVEDDMWDLVTIIDDNTAIFKRTGAPLFDPTGDGWWTQRFNRHRITPESRFYLSGVRRPFGEISEQCLDHKRHRSANPVRPRNWHPLRKLMRHYRRYIVGDLSA